MDEIIHDDYNILFQKIRIIMNGHMLMIVE